MTAFMESILTTAKALTARTREEMDDVDKPEDWDMLEKRFACAMIQARAQECRVQATNIVVVGKPAMLSRVPPEIRLALSLAMDEFSKALLDRSHYLEQTGMDIANGPWPPVEVEEHPTGLVM